MHARPSNRCLTAAAFLGLCAALAACRSSRGDDTFVEELSVQDAVPALGGDPQIERRLATVILGSREVGGLKTVRLELRNVSDAALVCSWTVDWFDRQGNRLNPARRTWTRAELAAGESVPVEIQAPGTAADSWKLRAVDPGSLQ